MGWTKPEFKRGRVDWAGKKLACPSDSDDLPDLWEWDLALRIINNWRSSHSLPLQIMKMTLLKRARSVQKDALVAQRIKRIPAIELKLRMNPNMQLSTMHDLGGCRAVVNTVAQVEKLAELYKLATAKNKRRGGEFVKEYDYINNPKLTGYRGVHLVYKYKSDSRQLKCYNGLRVEIQLRSKMQHAWATAVETVDTFTAQALKSNIGKDSWKRFFALAASAFAIKEKRLLIPGTPTTAEELGVELAGFHHEIATLQGFQKATEMIDQKKGNVFLLLLDSEKRQIQTFAFPQQQLTFAEAKYLELEKLHKKRPEMQVVLVSVQSFKSLRRAYPNYFLDITEFVSLVNEFVVNELLKVKKQIDG